VSVGSGGTGRDAVEVTYSAADILALNLAARRFWAGVIMVLAAALTLIPVILTLADGYPIKDSISAIDWPFTGWVLLALMIWIAVVTMGSYWWRKRKGLLGPVLLALTPKGLSVTSRQMDAVIFWSSIKSIKTGRKRTFLFMTSRSAVIIPLRDFNDEADFAAFVGEAKLLWRSEQPGPQ
jgi:hypothetical protein